MWIYTTNNEMINIAHVEKIELRQEKNLVAGEGQALAQGDHFTGVSIVAHFNGDSESQLAFIPASPNYDLAVTRYWNAIRTAIKAKAEVCDLMDIGH